VLGVFEPEKAIQAAAVVLKATFPHRMSRLRLLKLLYIANRENIARAGRSIVADAVAAMDHGPVLSTLYDCIKGGHAAALRWEQFIQRSGPRDLELVAEPGVGLLSRVEIELLQKVVEENECLDDWELVRVTHGFQEWKKNEPPPGRRNWISDRDILEAVGLGTEADDILAEARAHAEARRLLEAAAR
jgi:uncharacterized phage-associated protein